MNRIKNFFSIEGVKIVSYALLAIFLIWLVLDLFNIGNYTKDNPNWILYKEILTAFGGIGIIWGVYINSLRIKAQTDQNRIAGDSNSDKRFGDAIGYLNDESEGVVLGGIYVLYQLAKEDDRYVSIVSNLLCSYLKQKSKSLYSKFESESGKTMEVPIIVSTIVDMLFNDDSVFENEKFKLDNAVFKNITFEKGIKNCDFHSSEFYNCNFYSDVNCCDFSVSVITGCNFYNRSKIISRITDCKFHLAKISCCFWGTKEREVIMDHCDFLNANIESVVFRGVYCSNLSFQLVHFTGVTFCMKEILKCNLVASEFIKVVFKDVTSFDGSYCETNEGITYNNCSDRPF